MFRLEEKFFAKNFFLQNFSYAYFIELAELSVNQFSIIDSQRVLAILKVNF